MSYRPGLKCFVCIFLITFLGSCLSNKPDNSRLSYFNLADFIKNESLRLSAQKSAVDKTVFLNGKTEKKSIEVEDWSNELSAFRDADINKKSFLGKYEVDSITNGNDLLVRYSTQQESFRTKELAVQYNDGKLMKITATVAVRNVLYSSQQHLSYEPDRGYWISGNQRIRFLEPDSFYVEAKFDKM